MKIPPSILSDSYKASHYLLYPPCQEMVAYGEFRSSYDKCKYDHRMIFVGMRYIVEQHISQQWTQKDIDAAEHFYSGHGLNQKYPFPKQIFQLIVDRGGYFPVVIEALPEGTVVYPHIPVYQITATDEFAPLVTWLETLITMVWYPSTVATLSRRVKDLIIQAFNKSVDSDSHVLLESRLHDFGFRGCTCVEQSIIGASAHLLNFEGTDTMSGSYYAQSVNNDVPVGKSIPATEHSVMTSWPSEKEAIENLIAQYGDGVFACVMDSYDYAAALDKLLPSVASQKLERGGFMVLRPDSGDVVETVLMGLKACDKVFGSDANKLGYKVLRGCSVIQGDGINFDSIKKILEAVLDAGFSAQNVAFGMGGALLQRGLNRDTMNFATKLSSIRYKDGTERSIMKMPKTDVSKTSLPGKLSVVREDGQLRVYPKGQDAVMQVVYDHGKVCKWETFDQVKQRVSREWKASTPLPKLPVISQKLLEIIQQVVAETRSRQ